MNGNNRSIHGSNDYLWTMVGQISTCGMNSQLIVYGTGVPQIGHHLEMWTNKLGVSIGLEKCSDCRMKLLEHLVETIMLWRELAQTLDELRNIMDRFAPMWMVYSTNDRLELQ